MTAEDCRERARYFFGLAVFESEDVVREAWLVAGEKWMMRWRVWAPSSCYRPDDLLVEQTTRSSRVLPYRFDECGRQKPG